MKVKSYSSGIILALALFSAILVVHQSKKITPMIDYSYQVENAYRIFRGDMPFRDFFLVLPPGTYAVMAFVMILTGGYQHFGQVMLTATVQFFLVILTFNIIRTFQPRPWIAILFTLPVITADHVLFPWPNYDIFTVLFILISIFTFVKFIPKLRYQRSILFVSGIIATLPCYFKQNTGLLFTGLLTLVVIVSFATYGTKQKIIDSSLVIGGILISYLAFFGWLIFNNALSQSIYQLFEFPRSVRDLNEAIRIVTSQYIDVFTVLINILPYIGVVVFFLLFRSLMSRYGKQSVASITTHLITSILFFGSIVYFVVSFYRENSSLLYTSTVQFSFISMYVLYGILVVMTTGYLLYKKQHVPLYILIPIPLIGAANATYLSHHVVGSSFGLWPLFAIILAINISLMRKIFSLNWYLLTIPCICFITVQLFLYAMRNELHMYIPHDGSPVFSKTPRLSGLATPGNTIPHMDDMFAYVKKNIPQQDIVAFTPGDDPFFAVTGRENPMDFTQLHMQTYKLDFPTLIPEFKKRNVTWVVIKVMYQTPQYYGLIDVANDYFHLANDYDQVANLNGYYLIFKRKSL